MISFDWLEEKGFRAFQVDPVVEHPPAATAVMIAADAAQDRDLISLVDCTDCPFGWCPVDTRVDDPSFWGIGTHKRQSLAEPNDRDNRRHHVCL